MRKSVAEYPPGSDFTTLGGEFSGIGRDPASLNVANAVEYTGVVVAGV